MANNTTLPREEFGGDEFSNNLFSDLAPLLTLFGEQVTKQFLSMSLSQADNILLAMGPLGIMTVIVSAIRVGGVRQLKALVGRARESQSTAEQELLSSTSPDVCELWSGKEVVRLIGSPAGMKNLIIARVDGKTKVFDLAGAFNERLLQSPPLYKGDPNAMRMVHELSDAAPNLALNVKNATAPIWELWLWAAVGVVLQTAALVFPGMLTYFWKLEKGGQPIAPYGYPCFLIGTVFVVIGVAACGHVIEGITTEHNFTADEHPSKHIQKIVRLQRACTVSDQHFSSYAIFNSHGDLKIRTSRLNERDYSTLAAAATTTAVIGFIVQFIGLRALHWSATIIQLGVTLIMTGIRAYVRRGLATNPICDDILDGHEAAWLAMKISQDTDREQGSDSDTMPIVADEQRLNSKPLVRRIKQFFSSQPPKPIGNDSLELQLFRPQSDIPVCIWELPTLRYPLDGYEHFLANGPRSGRARGVNARFSKPSQLLEFYDCRDQWNFLFDHTSLDRTYATENDVLSYAEADEVELHANLHSLMLQHDPTAGIANQLVAAIERMLLTLDQCPPIKWKIDVHHGMEDMPSPIEWTIPVTVQTQRNKKRTKEINFRTRRVEADLYDGGGHRASWTLDDRERLYSVLSLWLYTLAERAKIMRTTEALEQRVGVEPMLGQLARGLPFTQSAYVRIVASDLPQLDDADSSMRDEPPHPLEDWLGRKVESCYSHNGICNINHYMEAEMRYPLGHDWPIFGAHLSATSARNYYVYTHSDTDLVTQCAQEILSIFMLAIAARVEVIRGGTHRYEEGGEQEDPIRRPRVLTNEVFDALARNILGTSLAHDINEAYALIIPAFAHHGLCPEPSL